MMKFYCWPQIFMCILQAGRMDCQNQTLYTTGVKLCAHAVLYSRSMKRKSICVGSLANSNRSLGATLNRNEPPTVHSEWNALNKVNHLEGLKIDYKNHASQACKTANYR